MRDRFRAQVRDEVKAAALRQLADGGPQAVSVNAIAKELGVSGPALYRYFANREDLLDALVLDAYADLARALEEAVMSHARRARASRLRALAHAYRRWAVGQPHRYRLLFAPPIPGAEAHTPAAVDAAHASMLVLLDVLSDGDDPGSPLPAPRPPALARQLRAWAHRRGSDVDPAIALLGISFWSRLHGLVGLEIGGSTASMGLDPELLLEHEVTALLSAIG
jgi:AcrR family transcriptional regulator